MAFIPRDYNDPLCVYSLRLLVSGYGGPIARVIRESDLIEGDVYPDSNNQVSYDSTIIVNPDETSALTLGEFLNISGYGNPDGLADVYEARINKLYDQSAAVNHIESPNFGSSFLFVEHSVPAIFPNSTSIHTINGIPSFLPLSTIPALTINNVRGREMSFHFVSENTSASTYFGFISLSPYYVVSGVWNESNSSVTTGVTPFSSEAWDMDDNYYNGVLGDVAGEFTRTRIGIPTDDVLICTIQTQLLDTSYTQSDFPDNRMDLSIYSNQWYADIIVYDGYDNIRRLTIEDLLSSGNVNVETKAFTSTLAFTDDGVVDNSFIAQFGTPAAAYSVRDLRGGVDDQGDRVTKIMRVRREIDHAEVDVYPDSTGWLSLDSPVVIVPAITGQIDGGTGVEIESLANTLGEFVADANYDNVDSLGSPTTAKVVVWYDQSDPDYLVDNLPESIQERGTPIRIRVIGGTYNNYEFDVYFDNNETISLSSYVADTYEITDSNGQVTAAISNGTLQTLLDAGMTEASVCVWYDQSGSGNDASQDVSSSQPKIVSERTNLLLQSNQFDTTWAPAGSSGIITSGFAGYDGSNDAWQLEHKGVQYTSIRQSISTSGLQTFSCYAKAGTLDYIILYTVSSTSPKVWFNLSTGQVGTMQGGVISASMESVGNGWYRCSFVFNDTITSARIYPNDADVSYGTTAGTIYIQDAQLEAGSSATEYIETTTSAVSVSGVVTENGKPAIQTDGTDDVLEASVNCGSNFQLALIGATKNGGFGYFTNLASTDDGVEILNFSSSYRFSLEGNDDTLSVSSTAQTLAMFSYDGTNKIYSVDGTENVDALTTTVAVSAGLEFGKRLGSNPVNAVYQEFILWNASTHISSRADIKSNINTYYDIYGTGNTGVNTPLLDTYSDAAAAYSLRKLRTSYNGPVNLNKRKDAIQNVSNAQPKIYDSSTGIVIKNSKPAVQFDGSDDALLANHADLYGQSRLDSFIHYQSSDNAFILYNDETGGGGRYSFVVQNGSTSTGVRDQYGSPDLYVNGTQVSVSYGTTTRGDLHTAIVTNGVSATAGAIETHLNSVTTNWDAFGISAYSGYRLNGKIAEMIFYNTPQDDNRIDIENKINSAFQIYAANFPSVLDTVPSAKAAYSIRRLTKEYVGPIYTLINSSDVQKEFYADFWGNLDVDAIIEFAGTVFDPESGESTFATSPRIVTWHDQSGNGNDLDSGAYNHKLTLTANSIVGLYDAGNYDWFDNGTGIIAEMNAVTASENKLVYVQGNDTIGRDINLNSSVYNGLKEIIYYA